MCQQTRRVVHCRSFSGVYLTIFALIFGFTVLETTALILKIILTVENLENWHNVGQKDPADFSYFSSEIGVTETL